MASLETLPLELLTNIAELCDWGCQTERTDHRPSQARYHSKLARTSWHMYHALNPMLYRRNLNLDDPELSCIHWAAKENRLGTLKIAVECSISLDASGDMLRSILNHEFSAYSNLGTPLHYAIRNGNREMTMILLGNGANVHTNLPIWCKCNNFRKDHYVLHTALAHSPMEDAADLLIRHGGACWIGPHQTAIPALLKLGREDLVHHIKDLPSATSSCFSFAIDTVDVELVRKLIERPEVDVNICDQRLETALVRAVKSGSMDILNLLLNHPKVDISHWVRREFGGIPILHCAALWGHQRMVERLLGHPRINADKRDGRGRTALHYAALNRTPRRTGIIKVLLDQPAVHVSDEDANGHTMLHFLCRHKDWNDHAEFVSLLQEFLDRGGPLDRVSSNGTAFHIALRYGQGDFRNATSLLERGADASVPYTCLHGYTPLHWCLMHEAMDEQETAQVDLVKALVSAGADLEADSDWDNASEYIPWHKDDDTELVDLCPSYGVDGPPLLFAAGAAQSEECVEHLLEHEASPNTTVWSGHCEDNGDGVACPTFLLTGVLHILMNHDDSERMLSQFNILGMLFGAGALLFDNDDENRVESPLELGCMLARRGRSDILAGLLIKATSANLPGDDLEFFIEMHSEGQCEGDDLVTIMLQAFYNEKY